MKAKLFPRSRPYLVSLLPYGDPLRSHSLFSTKLFFGPFSLILHPDGFLFLALPTSPNWNAFAERLFAPSPVASRAPPIPLILFEASLPNLLATLIHFALSSYERALCLPTSFPISGLARLEVKPSLCRSSWRAFVSIHSLMLPSTSPREIFCLSSHSFLEPAFCYCGVQPFFHMLQL